MPHSDPSPSSRREFRQAGAQVTGWIFIGMLFIACILYVIQDPGHWPGPVLICLALGLLVWSVLVRPSVVVARDGVTVRNLVRDVYIPWRQLDMTTRRWNLKVHTVAGRAFGAWAISQQRPRRQTSHSDPLMGGGFGGFGTPGSLRRRGGEKVSTEIEDRPSSAEAVGHLIDETKIEWDAMVAAGEITEGGASVRVQPAVPGIAALLLALACAVAAYLVLTL